LGAFLPLEKSFITCPAKNVIISTLKKDEDNNAVILRCYEMEGKDTNAAIDFFAPIKLLEKTNLIEEEGKPLPMINKQINLLIGHHAIETIKIVPDFEK
jgi:alpha-mannosidase